MITTEIQQKIDQLVECAKIADDARHWQAKTEILTLIGGLVFGDEWDSERVEMIADTLEPSDINLQLHAALWGIIS